MPLLGKLNDGVRRAAINGLYLDLWLIWTTALRGIMTTTKAHDVLPVWAALVDNHCRGKSSSISGLVRRLNLPRNTVTRRLRLLERLFGILEWDNDAKTKCRLSTAYECKAKGSPQQWDRLEQRINHAYERLQKQPRGTRPPSSPRRKPGC